MWGTVSAGSKGAQVSEKESHEVFVEGTQFYKKSAASSVVRTVVIGLVALIAIAVLAVIGIIDSGARQAYKEARDIRRALRAIGTEYYGNVSSFYDPNSPTGLTDEAASKIAEISTRDGVVYLYKWDSVNNVPLQFEYRTGLYRVIYTDAGDNSGELAGTEGDFDIYYSYEVLRFEAE